MIWPTVEEELGHENCVGRLGARITMILMISLMITTTDKSTKFANSNPSFRLGEMGGGRYSGFCRSDEELKGLTTDNLIYQLSSRFRVKVKERPIFEENSISAKMM